MRKDHSPKIFVQLSMYAPSRYGNIVPSRCPLFVSLKIGITPEFFLKKALLPRNVATTLSGVLVSPIPGIPASDDSGARS